MRKNFTTVASYIKHFLNLSSYSQKEVAQKLGYKKPNMISMLKNGHTALPLSKIGPFAAVLEMNPEYLMKLVLSEYYPDVFESLKPILQGLEMSEDELDWMYTYRKIRKDNPDAYLEIYVTPISKGSSES